MNVTERHRLNIGEFVGLLESKGYKGDSLLLRKALGDIPAAKTNVEHLSELLSLTRLRTKCYKIAGDNPELKQFLARQALLHAEQPV